MYVCPLARAYTQEKAPLDTVLTRHRCVVAMNFIGRSCSRKNDNDRVAIRHVALNIPRLTSSDKSSFLKGSSYSGEHVPLPMRHGTTMR